MKKTKEPGLELAVTNDLVSRINERHTACENAVKSALMIAIEAGELLVQARDLTAHGQWIKWLKANFRGTRRTANLYMTLYERRDELRNGVAHSLSIREAEKLTRRAKNLPSEPTNSAVSVISPKQARVAKLVKAIRSELQSCSEDEMKEATLIVREALSEMGPKQKTYEEFQAERARELAPYWQLRAEQSAAAAAEEAKKSEIRKAKRKAKQERERLETRQRLAEWLASQT